MPVTVKSNSVFSYMVLNIARIPCLGFLTSTWNSGLAGSGRLPITIFVQPGAVTAGGGNARASNTVV